MNRTPKTLFLFIDGMGVGSDDPAINPIFAGAYPALQHLLTRLARPIDARLNVPGTPQSATGQATILSGVNAAQANGRHAEGYPGPTLVQLIEQQNIFTLLAGRGYSGTFANAYHVPSVEEVYALRRKSVTTVATLKAFGRVRLLDDLLAGKAVYQDITRQVIRDRGLTVPLVEPEEAAAHLMDVAREHDFTLFEYFQTDLMAHKGTDEQIGQVLHVLDRFVAKLLTFPNDPGHLFVMTSDHGNIEDGRHRQHTRNPVPFVAIGSGAETLHQSVLDLSGIVPALLLLYPNRNED